MRLEQLLKLIESRMPSATAMDGDRIGLQLQSGREEVFKILVALELNEEVVQEAARLGRDCIITFHPLIYRPLAEITDSERVGKLVTQLIQHSIALVSVHTIFDAFVSGTSKILADRLGLEVIGFLDPNKNFTDCGMGVIAKPEKPMNLTSLVSLVGEVCMSPVKYTSGAKEMIERIAIVGGSGGSFIDKAISEGADAFITADITYHTFHAVKGRISLIDPGHYEMEQFVPHGLASLLNEIMPQEDALDIVVSMVLTNPVSYYPGTGSYIQNQKNYLSTL